MLQLKSGIGDVSIRSLYNYADKNNLRFSKVINEINQGKTNEFQTHKILVDTIAEIVTYKERFNTSEKDINDLLEELFSVIPNCESDFITKAKKFIDVFEINSIDGFIYNIIEYLGPNESIEEQASGVRIMTMHKAKGLSASAVFVVGVEDENIPGIGNAEEERRLLYVSLTRARNYLFLTYCENSMGQQQHSGHIPIKTTRRNISRYIKDIPSPSPVEGENFNLL